MNSSRRPAFLFASFFAFSAVLWGVLTPSSYALSEDEVDSLLDEGARMRTLMLRMQTQLNQPALPGIGKAVESKGRLGLESSTPWAPMSVMLEGSLRERWFQSIERGVLSSSLRSPDPWEGGEKVSVAVGFVQGEDLPWYGALRVHGHQGSEDALALTGVRARLTVAPRFEDGSFLHFGVSFHSMEHVTEKPPLASIDPAYAPPQNFSRGLGIDLGYVQGDYAFQAQYLTSSGSEPNLLFSGSPHPHEGEPRDGFFVSGAWRLSGEQAEGPYASGLLSHLEPRDEEGMWDLVVRYANLGESPKDLRRNPSGSVLLGIHWRASPTLAVELDFVEGTGESLDLPVGSDLSLRGVFSF